jgi:hypothetical protein
VPKTLQSLLPEQHPSTLLKHSRVANPKKVFYIHLGFSFGSTPTSIPSMANQLPTIPASMSNSGTGLAIPSTLFARCMSVHTGKTANLEELDESKASIVDEPIGLGSIVEATEDLEALLSKIGKG